ncbi:MAG: hypothetical protein CVU39_04415 [Chloroflexi bacterium HGW-Chloroflexi-10]|nr:MAG: hypothetical protein CVU39_04415 [Chloroflexi bacterium HGW-Chloroflexi-10]
MLQRFIFSVSMMLSVLFSMVQPSRSVSAAFDAQLDHESYTYRLTQSTGVYQLWTTLPSEKIFKDTALPADAGAEVKVFAAKNEFEPFVVAVKPTTSGNVTVSIGSFGSGITAEIYQVKYVNITTTTDYSGRSGYNPDPLWPLSSGAAVNVAANENTAFWFSLHVAESVAAGDYTANVSIGGVSIPVRLHVFNFAIPQELHVASQMNFSQQAILSKYGVSGTGADYWTYVDKIKQYMIDHRLTPSSVLWSGGLTTNGASPYIDYNCNGTFTDNDGIWGFEDPAERYIAGSGLMNGTFSTAFNNGTGFSSFMAATFRNNDASADQRPDSFCGQTRTSADWYTANNPNTPYNQKWFQYMVSMQNYLNNLGYLDEGYYYLANEPQDQTDYNAVAWYSQEIKKVAPNLKLMLSEEPKPEIYANPTYPGAKIDIWLAFLGIHFKPEVALERLKNHNEETWIYFLKSTYYPRFNPFTIDHAGVEAKFSGWFLWKYRLRGLAYYRFNDWGVNPWTSPYQNGQNGESGMMYPPSENNTAIAYGSNGHRFVPSIRLELLRDGLEDYEYFYMLNGGQQPQPYQSNPADSFVNQIIGGVQAYNRDSDMLYNLRRLIGLKIGGEINSIADITPNSTHSRSDGVPGSYYINFQDPGGNPIGTVTDNGHTYMKIGNSIYSAANGYGWQRSADVPVENFYQHYDQWFEAQPIALLQSSIIDDWGRDHVFEFELPNGIYNVTVGVGYRGGTRPHTIRIEGVPAITNETTSNSAIIRTVRVTVKDKKLTLVMGMYAEAGHINFLDIVPGEEYDNFVYLPACLR